MCKTSIFYAGAHRLQAALIVLSIVLFMLAGCQSVEQPITLQRALRNSCLQDVVPGLSDEVHTRRSLESCTTIVQDSLVRSEGKIGSTSGVSYTWRVLPSQTGKLDIVDGVVNMIVLQVKTGSDLGTLTDEMGNPESIYASYQVHEHCIASITLDYPGRGFSAGIAKEFDCSTLLLDSTVTVSEYYLYPAGALDEVLQNSFYMTEQNIVRSQDYRTNWQGFGAIQVKPLE
jgi:hypothetical protein